MPSLLRDQDFLAGLAFISIAVGYVFLGQDLPFGGPRRMGPGFFPLLLSGILVALGLLLVFRALWRRGDVIQTVALRPILIVAAATLSFAVLLEGAGLVAAVVTLVLLSSLASTAARPLPAALLAVGVAVFCVLVFTMGLGLPLPILGQWLTR